MNEQRPETPADAGDSACDGAWVASRMHELIGELEVLEALGFSAPAARGDEAVAALVVAERLGRMVDSVRVRLAGEIGELCRPELSNERLSVRNGFSSPARFIASLTGTWVSTATERMRLSARVRSQTSAVGLTVAARFPAVQRAFAEGRLGVDAAEVVTRKLSEAASAAGYTNELAAAEKFLVEAASQCAGDLGFTANQLGDLAVNPRDRLDPDGAEPRDAKLCEKRSMTFLRLPSGMTKMIALLPPEDAAAWLAIDAATQSPRVRPSFPAEPGDDVGEGAADRVGTGASEVATGSGGASEQKASRAGNAPDEGIDVPIDPVFADTRTSGQKRLDTFTELIRRAAALPEVPHINGMAATVSVHADLDDIVEGRGLGWIPGLPEPLPASAVQQMLCHADIRTTVFGESGEVLSQGKKQRLFTVQQVRALAARDGGCVWPGCDRPPSWCESHHVEPWRSPEHPAGRTDVDNGALLCHFHHAIVHKSDWTLTMIDGAPHFLPPTSLDWRRNPLPATQQRTRTRVKTMGLSMPRERRELWQRDSRRRSRP